MHINNQKGFSLVELVLVVVIIGIIAAIAVPSLSKAIAAAENGSAVATLKTIALVQTSLMAEKNRYGRLDEVNTFQNGKLGTVGGYTLLRGKYTYEMIPSNPSDAQLKTAFKVKATRTVDASQLPFVLENDQLGNLVQITP